MIMRHMWIQNQKMKNKYRTESPLSHTFGKSLIATLYFVYSNNKENVHDIKKVMINWLILDRNLATISSVNISCITFTLSSFSSPSFKDNITIFHSFARRLLKYCLYCRMLILAETENLSLAFPDFLLEQITKRVKIWP